ncbi:hypothetical protein [Candidatus Poriferisodalis sp.]|uniref:hypothetical protein n=1 Tax=Candidatus Poriferisodalis sp. TaxID=3101277 RepID=UPI003B5C2163
MDYQVIDTNVLMASNGVDTHADRDCQQACAQRLKATQDHSTLVLDTGWEILGEYQRRLARGQPNYPGYIFFTWAARTAPGLRITLTPDETRTFKEFPPNEDLADFDEDDRKFVAAASEASRSGPTCLVNALDGDYEYHKSALEAVGVQVDELCPQHIGS